MAKRTIEIDGGKYAFDIDEHGLMTDARRNGEHWEVGFRDFQYANVFGLMLEEIARLRESAVPPTDVDPVKAFLAIAERWKVQSNETTIEWKALDGSTSFRMGPPRERKTKKRPRVMT